ncbi:PGPGW domain-containing protein [Pseudoroseomonas sp. WGS1072]|uniref:PGPGW domain-containing protein n=1 Tax=Roseomonas sp. WGS1072 TaxID=3366816 RepID=UPI003BF039CD
MAGRTGHLRSMVALRPSWKRRLAGWSLLLLGVIGLILPLLNGTIFLLLGLFVLREQYVWSQRCLAWCDRRWPGRLDSLAAVEAKMLRWCRESGGRLRRRLGLG